MASLRSYSGAVSAGAGRSSMPSSKREYSPAMSDVTERLLSPMRAAGRGSVRRRSCSSAAGSSARSACRATSSVRSLSSAVRCPNDRAVGSSQSEKRLHSSGGIASESPSGKNNIILSRARVSATYSTRISSSASLRRLRSRAASSGRLGTVSPVSATRLSTHMPRSLSVSYTHLRAHETL